MSIQFVSDAAGKPTAVLISIEEWELMKKTHDLGSEFSGAAAPTRLSRKERVKENFREAVREMKAGKGRPVRELLAELDELSNQDA